MYEFINATKDSYATDEADDDAELGRLRQRVAELEEILARAGILEPGKGKS
jgi:transcription elongation GreA/GreB family factor